MKILLLSIGTRGDIEPFLAIGEIFKKKGHKVAYGLPEQYCQLVLDENEQYALSPRLVELIESEDGQVLMGGTLGIIKKLKSIYRLYKEGKEINKILVKEQYNIVQQTTPDIIIHNGKCNYPLLWQLQTGKKTVLASPVPYFIHYAEGNGHIGFKGDYGKWINKLTYNLANFGAVKTIFNAQKNIPVSNSKFPQKEIKKALFSEKLVYSISPTLFQRPDGWESNIQVLGHHERNMKSNWKPDQSLMRFLDRYKKIVFLTFGSMVSPNPEKVTQIFLSVLDELKTPAIINIAGGGLVKLEKDKNNPLFYFTNQIPYNWILEKCYGIIHHGGSGTTHSGLKNGCVSMIVPHIFDQYGWNHLIFKNGLGPKGVAINKISTKKLKPLISDLMENKAYEKKAEELSMKIKKEDYEEELYSFIMS